MTSVIDGPSVPVGGRPARTVGDTSDTPAPRPARRRGNGATVTAPATTGFFPCPYRARAWHDGALVADTTAAPMRRPHADAGTVRP